MGEDINLKRKKIRREIRIINILLLAIIIILAFYSVINYSSLKQYVSFFLKDYGLLSLFIIVFIFEFFPQVMSPDYSLLLAIGLGMNTYNAVVVTMIASIIAGITAFLIGYHYGFATIAPFFKQKDIDKTLRFWDRHGKWFVLAAGVIPLPIPYFPLVFGALRMELKEFLLWGVIPRALCFILTGIVGYYGINGFFGLI